MPRKTDRPGGDKRRSSRPQSSSSSSRSSGGFRKRSEGGEDKPRFGGKPSFRKSGPRFGSGEDRGDRKPGGFKKDFDPSKKRSEGSDERPRRSFDKREGGEERRSSRPYGSRPERGGDERPKRSFGRPEGGDRPERPRRSFNRDGDGDSRGGDERRSSRPYGARPERGGDERPKRSFGRSEGGDKPERPRRSFRRDGDGDAKGGDERRSSRPYGTRPERGGDERPKRSYGRSEGGDKPERPRRSFSRDGDGNSKGGDERRSSRPYGARPERGGDERPKRPYGKSEGAEDGKAGEEGAAPRRSYSGNFERKSFSKSRVKRGKSGPSKKESRANVNSDLIRLNKYVSNSGVCSRREADERIKMGLVSVNGVTITEMGHKVKITDDVRYEGKKLKAEKPVYILVNKPKGFITTTDDPQDRNTVMHLIGEVKERVYPVGRLDRNTTGLLLLTNDGDLADKLTHPSYNVKKIYKVELDRPITKADFEKIQQGVHLEEGKAVPDDLAIVDDDSKTLGIELHIGWNRIVRRIFESLQYEVVKLDRVVYAGLDKKALGRGEWRFLKDEEVIRLKHLQ